MKREMGLDCLMRKYILSSERMNNRINKFSEDCHGYLFSNSLTFPQDFPSSF